MFSFMSRSKPMGHWLSKDIPPPEGFKDYYSFRIDKFYKIWFSDNPDVFLGIENELRFIRMRENNKTHTLVFIYSSKCLNSNAIQKLKTFCVKFSIQPVDFDAEDFSAMLTEQLDIDLYNIAQLEIKNTLAKAYGSFAAASDCARLLVPVIERFGIYTDFDIEHTLSTLNSPIISVRAPVLLNSQIMYDDNDASVFANSDFLAFSFDYDNPKSLSKEALTAIKNLQQMIKDKYLKPITESSFTANPNCKIDFGPAKEIFRQARKDLTIFQFREFICNYQPKSSREKAAQEYLYNISVIAITGPDIYPVMYKHLMPAKFKFIPYQIARDDAWGMYLSIFNKSSLKFYDPIADRIKLTNSVAEQLLSKFTAREGELADKSWTSGGLLAKQIRESNMNTAAKTIQSFWRNKPDYHTILLNRAKPLCTPNYFKYLQEKNYTLVFRNACNDLNLKLIKILLHYRECLNIDINEPSKTGNKTALDWAMASTKGSNESKQIILDLLTAAGARPAQNIKSRLG